MTGIIFHPEHMTIYAQYESVAKAVRMLHNAITKGHKLQGRKYRVETLQTLVVDTPEEHAKLDVEVEAINLMSGKPFMIKKSMKGNQACDPSMEGYWSM